MLLQVFGHTEALDLLISEDGGHGLIGGEPLLVLGVLEFLLLQIGPESLHTLKRRITFVREMIWEFPLPEAERSSLPSWSQ